MWWCIKIDIYGVCIHLNHAKECMTCLINPFPLLIDIIQGSKSILTILQFVEPVSVLKENITLIFCNHDLESERFSNCLNFKALKKSKALKFQTSLVECNFVCNVAVHMLSPKNVNKAIFLSDPSPIIVYSCHSQTQKQIHSCCCDLPDVTLAYEDILSAS